ncbi:hypothetical protein [Dactylosporangium sp. CA-092794]|uniref:hypothetical protein n=1 Tax=Dactylosporangium sp. CA-092794 TaxID=3239929 RepID=UPI003D93EBFC
MQPQQLRHRITRTIGLLPVATLTDSRLLRDLVGQINEYNTMQRTLPPGLVATEDRLAAMTATLRRIDAIAGARVATAAGADAGVLGNLLLEVAEQLEVVADLGVLRRLPSAVPAAELHVCWAGGEIRPATLDNVLAWAATARAAGWAVTVWTGPRHNAWPERTVRRLEEAGVRLASVDRAVIDPRLWAAYEAVTTAEKPDFPAASDLTRYSILATHGGVSVDAGLPPIRPEALDGLRVPLPLPLTGVVHDHTCVVSPAGSPALSAVIDGLAELTAFGDPAQLKPFLIGYVAEAAGIDPDRAADVVALALSAPLPLGQPAPAPIGS